MDHLAFLEGRLDFIRRFYLQAAEPFQTVKRKIDAEEEPFIPRSAPGDHDGPEYLSEWIDADDSLRVLGQSSLNLVAKAIQDYLRQFILREADNKWPPVHGDGWFEKYENFLFENTTFRWDGCPVDRGFIEQINLCRNDATHDPVIETTWPKQTDRHFQKYPQSFFADEMEQAALASETGIPEFPSSIHVSADKLAKAIDSASAFCQFVEAHRTRY